MTDKTRKEFDQWCKENNAPDGNFMFDDLVKGCMYEAWLAAKEKYEPRWICCEDRIPDCIGSYLVFGSMTDPDCNEISWAFFNSAGEWCDTQGYFSVGVTHWMTLPTPPSTQGGGE